MALPQQQPSYAQVVERAPRSPAWFGQLMGFAIMLLVLAVVVYFGITFGYHPYLEKQVSGLDQEISDFSRRVPADQQAAILTFYSQLANLKTALAKHTATPAFLSWIEDGTLQSVRLTKVSMNVASRQIQVTGIARNQADVALQVAAFQARPGIERVDFRNSQAIATGYQFDIAITVVQGFFTAASQSLSSSPAPSPEPAIPPTP